VYKIGTTIITSPNTFSRGTTTVTVVATNSCGSTTNTFTVIVNDNQNPSIICKPNATRTTTSSTYTVSGTEFDATAADNCGISSLVYRLRGATTAAYNNSNISLNLVKLNIGTTTITWRATDVNGKTTNCNINVVVAAVAFRKISFDTSAGLSKSLMTGKADLLQHAGLKVNVTPNPTSDYFTLVFRSVSKSKIKLVVYDITGRLVDQNLEIPANSSLQLGNEYQNGLYIAELIQGGEKVVLKLAKSK
jgi:hypothetical protein